MISDLNGSLGSRHFLYVVNESRERAHLKVPGCLLVWNELLTKKVGYALSRLNEISAVCEKIILVSESFWSSLKFLRIIDLTAWLWGWNVRVNGMRSKFSFSAVVLLAIDQFVGRSGGLPERQKQDSHVYRKTGTLPLIFRKNQSRHCVNDEVWETVKKVWNSCRVMNAKMNTASNCVNLLVCSKHWCTDRCLQLNFWCLYSRHYINDEVCESV